MLPVTFHAPVVRLFGQFVDDGQFSFVVTNMTQLGDEVIGDVIYWANKTRDLCLADQSLAELRPVFVPLAALPTTVTNQLSTWWAKK